MLSLFLLTTTIRSQNQKSTSNSLPVIMREALKFEHLNVEDGLSQSWVHCIIQDRKGFMWIGTQDGLNKYDGYNFKIYKYNSDDSTSIGSNYIRTIYEDHLGELWIGTIGGGLCRYDRYNDAFVRYQYSGDNPNSICTNAVVCIFESENDDRYTLWIGGNNGLNKYNRKSDDFTRYYPEENKLKFKTNVNWIGSITQDRSGQVWIGTWREGLFKYNAEKDRFVRYQLRPEHSGTFVNQYVWKLFGSRWNDKSIIWMGSDINGLYKIDTEHDQIKNYFLQSDNPASISDNRIITIYQKPDENNVLWIGTEQGGLNRLNIRTEEFTHFKHQTGCQQSLKDNRVMSIFEDKSGLMWIGTLQGISKFEPRNPNFQTIQENTVHPNGLRGNYVTAIHESGMKNNQPVLWIGTRADGLNSLNRNSGRFTTFTHVPENINSISSNWITTISEFQYNGRNVLWVSTIGGFNRIDLVTKQIKRFYIPQKNPVHNEILAQCVDKNGRVWLGTQGTFLFSFDPVSEQFTEYKTFWSIINTLYVDRLGMLWIGTGGGLFKMNTSTLDRKRYWHNASDPKSISNNIVWSIIEDREGIIWIGTSGGLNRFDRNTETFSSFEEKDGLSNNTVRAMLEDDHGNLWLSTNKGISHFNPITKEFRNYDATDGLQGDEFYWDASCMNSRGEMFFGGINGLTYFHPDSIIENTYIPPIVLTDFQIFNKSIKPGIDSPLKEPVSEVKEIILSHNQTNFTLEFAALDYHNSGKNKYAYMMENVDPDWVHTDASRRFATYTHLDPGEYVFQVKGSNNDGIWNETGTSVKITILPPWWRTTWAYLSYIVFIIALIYFLRRYELNRLGLKHNLEIKDLETGKLLEMDHLKSKFFANISHEFRTPLTLILAPIDELVTETRFESHRKVFKRIKHNAKRLLSLINQLLDLSRLEASELKLHAIRSDIVQLSRSLLANFESMAVARNISLKFKSSAKALWVWLDTECYEKIITNLLSNAFKFSEGDSVITIELQENPSSDKFESGSVTISVSDQGKGMPDGEVEKIFNRFYQTDDDLSRSYEGSGIGLALVKELVELHHGTIGVKSFIGKGTKFTIELHLGKSHLSMNEISKSTPEAKKELKELYSDDSDEVDDHESAIEQEKATILIVEDNRDMQQHLAEILQKDFNLHFANNGERGLSSATEKIPELILSDVMMPEMNGIEMCKKIKTDKRTSHIPVILLTARAGEESKLEGLDTGADEYLEKPFSKRELMTRIRNLIAQRKHLQLKFAKNITFQVSEMEINRLDKDFLSEVISCIEKNLSSSEYSVEILANDLFLSRIQLHRKLSALCGKSASEFIRSYRLAKAAELFDSKQGNVSQVAYQTGFNSLNYFSKMFKQQYGVLPSEYSKKSRNM